MGSLDGRVAVVTGGASGIGAAIVTRLVADGAAVVCADIDDAGGERVVGEVVDRGGNAVFCHCDVGVLTDMESAVAEATSRFGGLDILSANAMWSSGGYIADIDPDGWDRTLRVMLTGVFYGMRAAIPAMLERGGGSIVTMSSIEGFGGEMRQAPYATAKAGVTNLTRNAAIEYGRRGIRANAICPGTVDTPLFRRFERGVPRTRDDLAAMNALGRIIDPSEIASVAAFLASDESSAITGTTIVVDAGLMADISLTGFPAFGE